MIRQHDIGLPFSHISKPSEGVLKWRLQMPAFTDWYYCKSSSQIDRDVLIVLRNEDDKFVESLFTELDTIRRNLASVTKISIGFANEYNFDSAVIVCNDYHGYLKGTFDLLRDSLYLCIPAYHCEFSGDESLEEFSFQFVYRLERTLRRPVCPKLRYKLVNPATGINSGENWLFSDHSALYSLVHSLSGIRDAKVVVENYLRETLTILSSVRSQFIISPELGGFVRDHDSVIDSLNMFLKFGLAYLS